MRFDVFSLNRFVDEVGKEDLFSVTLSRNDALELANLALLGAKRLEIQRRAGDPVTPIRASNQPVILKHKDDVTQEEASLLGKALGLWPFGKDDGKGGQLD